MTAKKPANRTTSAAPRPENGDQPQLQGILVARFGNRMEVESDSGERIRCKARRKLADLVCGDRVTWQRDTGNSGVIVERDERSTLLGRPDRQGRLKPVAANVNQLVVVSATKPGVDLDLIDRYLVAGETLGIAPAVLINKIDLLDTAQGEALQRDLADYHELGYPVVYTSTRQEHGIDSLAQLLAGHLSVLLGLSGVGKSSLIQQLLPDIDIRIGELSEATELGKHTTTTAQLYHLPCGGSIIDSPGVREFGLWDVTPAQAAQGFREFRDFIPGCRFRNCRHMDEPGCAVAQATADGAISQRRFDSYRRIVESLA